MLISIRTVMWGAMLGMLLTGGCWLVKPTMQQVRPVQDAVLGAPLKQFSVRVGAKNAKPAQAVFRISENDEVAIRVTSEQAGTLMLHGYTDGVTVVKNGEATVRFKATHTGRFPLHLHGEGGSHVELANIEILPR